MKKSLYFTLIELLVVSSSKLQLKLLLATTLYIIPYFFKKTRNNMIIKCNNRVKMQ